MSNQYPSRLADKFVVRLPDGLRSEIQGAADHSDTSMNTVFVQAVRQYLDGQQRQQLLLDALSHYRPAPPPIIDKLQQDLNERDEQLHELELRRRAEFDAGQAAERRVEVLETALSKIKLRLDAYAEADARMPEPSVEVCRSIADAALRPAGGGGNA